MYRKSHKVGVCKKHSRTMLMVRPAEAQKRAGFLEEGIKLILEPWVTGTVVPFQTTHVNFGFDPFLS